MEQRTPSFGPLWVSTGPKRWPLGVCSTVRFCPRKHEWRLSRRTDEFSYICIDDIPLGISRAWAVSFDSLQMQPNWDVNPLFSQASKLEPNTRTGESRFLPTSWWSRIFRFFYISVFAAVCLLTFTSLMMMMMQGEDNRLSATGAVALATITVFLAIAVCSYSYYSIHHGCKSTIIPCINKTWYKVLTMVVFLFWTVFLVFSAIETRMMPCGKYTTGLVGLPWRTLPVLGLSLFGYHKSGGFIQHSRDAGNQQRQIDRRSVGIGGEVAGR